MKRFDLAQWLKLLLMPLLLTILVSGCGVFVRGVAKSLGDIKNSGIFHQGRHGPLNEAEMKWAKIAWTYFENNLNPKTGLVNSLDNYPSTTMWHIGDYIAALVAAREFELIDHCEFDERLSLLLNSLNSMPLFLDRLPNKAYHTKDWKMVNFNNEPEAVGWSAIDIGRLLIWMKIIRDRYPIYSEYVDKAILRWNFCDIIDQCGQMYGGVLINDEIEYFQEGRLGYEEYSALGYQVWGMSTHQASLIEPARKLNIYDVEILYDSRDTRIYGAYAPIVTMPYVLHGMEFGWQSVNAYSTPEVNMAKLADNVYKVQEQRFKTDKIFTARTDHPLLEPPFFVHDAIVADGHTWSTISDAGDVYSEAALVSTRAAFGMWVLWDTDYTDDLLKVVDCLYDKDRGWYEGRFEKTGGYEKSITASSNAAVLEVLLYKKRGQLFKVNRKPGYYRTLLSDEFKHPGRCFPPEQEECHEPIINTEHVPPQKSLRVKDLK